MKNKEKWDVKFRTERRYPDTEKRGRRANLI